jgi:hypothetical protein
MSFIFANVLSFNQLLNSWNVSFVIDMSRMFDSTNTFNQNLSSWDVDQVTSCNGFNDSTPSWILPKPKFNSCYFF